MTAAPPIPTLVTWCAECGRAGKRFPGQRLDEDCRYCHAKGSVKRRCLESKKAATRFLATLLQKEREVREAQARDNKPPPGTKPRAGEGAKDDRSVITDPSPDHNLER